MHATRHILELALQARLQQAGVQAAPLAFATLLWTLVRKMSHLIAAVALDVGVLVGPSVLRLQGRPKQPARPIASGSSGDRVACFVAVPRHGLKRQLT